MAVGPQPGLSPEKANATLVWGEATPADAIPGSPLPRDRDAAPGTGVEPLTDLGAGTELVVVSDPTELAGTSDTGDAARLPVSDVDVQAAYAAAAHSYQALRIATDEVYRLIGRLSVERYHAQFELAELKGLPVPEHRPELSWRAARRGKRQPAALGEDTIDAAELKAVARRRQVLVLGTAVVIVLCLLVYRINDWHWFPDHLNRRALRGVAGIGLVMQLMYPVFMVMRIVNLTDIGKRWLFPTAAGETVRRRRKRIRGW